MQRAAARRRARHIISRTGPGRPARWSGREGEASDYFLGGSSALNVSVS